MPLSGDSSYKNPVCFPPGTMAVIWDWLPQALNTELWLCYQVLANRIWTEEARAASRGGFEDTCLLHILIDLVAKGLQQCRWGHTLGGNGIQPRIWVCVLSMTVFPIMVGLNCCKRDKPCKVWTVYCMAIYRKSLLTSGLDYGKNYIWHSV